MSPAITPAIASSVPPIAPHGSPAPSAFAKATRSGCTPNASIAPPHATVAPVFTSSKARYAPFSWQISLIDARYPGSGSVTPRFVMQGSTIIPAIRSGNSSNTRFTASASLNGTTRVSST
jgi:hypothetical protein